MLDIIAILILLVVDIYSYCILRHTSIVFEILYVMYMCSAAMLFSLNCWGHIWVVPVTMTPPLGDGVPLKTLAFFDGMFPCQKYPKIGCNDFRIIFRAHFVVVDCPAAICKGTPPWTVDCLVRRDCYRYLQRPGQSAREQLAGSG